MKLRFTAVLTLYQEREDQAKAELGRLEMARGPLLQVIEAIATERRAALAGPVIPALRETLLAFCTAAEVRQRQAQDRLRAHDSLIDKARTALAEAHRARTTIEKLREHDAAEIRRRQDKREQRQLDELATRNHLLSMGG